MKVTRTSIVVWAVFYVALSAFTASVGRSSPIWPAPLPGGACAYTIYFDGWMGCIPLFRAVCQ
jgi:hypothetical protein